MNCLQCGACCKETEMLLSNGDIERLTKKGFNKTFFSQIDKNGYATLKNYNGYCVFYDVEEHKCTVYEDKPEGCSVYPVILDEKKGIVIDYICIAKYSITFKEKQEKGKQVIALLRKIDEQARARSSD